MAVLKIKDETGKFVNIPAIQGAPGKDGNDGKDAPEYVAGEGIKIDGNVISTTGPEVIEDTLYINEDVMFSSNDYSLTDYKQQLQDLLNNNIGRYVNIAIYSTYNTYLYGRYFVRELTKTTTNAGTSIYGDYKVFGTSPKTFGYKCIYFSYGYDVDTGKYKINTFKLQEAPMRIAFEDDVLKKTNTTEYIPTKPYHPATKDYVDNTISNAISTSITTALEGSY